MKVRPALVAAMFLVTLTVGQTASAGGGFRGIGFLPGSNSSSRALEISADGSTVAGNDSVSYVNGTSSTGFRWTEEEGMVQIPSLHATITLSAVGVMSGDGRVIIGQSYLEGIGSTGYRWTSEGGTEVFPIDNVRGVSTDGSVVIGETLMWTEENGTVGLPLWGSALSDDGQIVTGTVNLGNGIYNAAWWTEQSGVVSIGRPPGAERAYGKAASADAQVIAGFARYESGNTGLYRAFRWTQESGLVLLDGLVSTSTVRVTGVSAAGSVIVGWWYPTNVGEPWIWDETRGARNLQDMLTEELGLDLTGWTLGRAYDISDDGLTIVGEGTNPDGRLEAWIATIPEPATLSLLVLGGLVLIRRRRSG